MPNEGVARLSSVERLSLAAAQVCEGKAPQSKVRGRGVPALGPANAEQERL